MTIKDLLDIYAEQHEQDRDIVEDDFYMDLITPKDLLGAYLEYEGIFGYEQALWSVFQALREEKS